MEPTVGRIVHYKLDGGDANAIYQGRDSDAGWGGNSHRAGDVLPMVIVRINDSGLIEPTVNGQVFLDGNDSLWVASVREGESEGKWSWPPRV